jgi:ubiquinone/menaquinone biosynthesis C-methylase UbiE
MGRYYAGRQARSYHKRLRAVTERTLSEALAMVDLVALQAVSMYQGSPLRALDVACGTGSSRSGCSG